MTSPFTLIAFHCNEIDLEYPPQSKQPSLLAQVLEYTKEHRVKIYLGAYVFDTRKGWRDMHRLCEFLRIHKRNFVRLSFEAELFACTSPDISEALGKLGVTLYQYPPEDR